ncbi:O-methylsterigmatocystin oxidoreductase [Mycena sanguinolenta]|uniref:O-methylsterigmatocystin oxidoreductase n=1 Tax=Mycena sanguinolenta TaxID=230812 RepID=A0A8H7CSA0_9AGAR|nr:O-methylsterigmatocystin oxidoreductase [Mycena sanguinolenta]
MEYSSLALSIFSILLLGSLWKFISAWQRRHLPFPPGPPPYPLIGNVRDFPKKLPWVTYANWGIQYGSDLVHASALGHHIVIVNSVKAAVELFEKRSHLYADRPVVAMIELMGWDFNAGTLRLGNKWREHRRMFQQHFRQEACRNYRPIQMKSVHQLLQRLLADPHEFREHIKTQATHYLLLLEADNLIPPAEHAAQKLAESVLPGAFAVNVFPILRYIPSWMPGGGFHRFAAEVRQLTEEMREVPFNFVRQNMREGLDSKSMVARLLEENQAGGFHNEAIVKDVAATAYAAGADTLWLHFFLAMAIHPEVQKKAQIEIDTVIGTHRLPDFEDRPSLPYIEAVYREVMRWKPVVPLGLAHANTTDDIYNGYFIPKGATVISNIWAMTRDESIYPESERFNPDRFFTADGKLNGDDTILAFGFGRRICVGRYNADASVWATIVSVLSTFNIVKAKDAAGNEIDIAGNYSDGLISHPLPFPCSIIPRSETARSLVQSTTETDDW